MRVIPRIITGAITSVAITAALCGAYTYGAENAEAAYRCVAEDRPAFNAAKCGNRTLGVRIDITPNNTSNGKRWVVLKFAKDGKSGTFKPRRF